MCRKGAFDGDPIFIGGDGRSGTTLLCLILDSHPDLVVGPELHFGGPKNLGPYVLGCCELLIAKDPRAFGKGLKQHPELKRGVQFVKRCHRFGVEFAELHRLVEQQMDASRSDLVRFEDRCALINAVGEFRRSGSGVDRWGIKIMRDIGKLDAYGKVWPNAQFIHILRDGRDVAASQMLEHGTWGYGDIKVAAKKWADLISKTRKLAKPYRMMEVKYEDLVVDSERTIRRLLDFLGVCWDESVLHHSRIDHSLFANPYHHPSIATVVNPINAFAVGRYRRDLTSDQITSFNRIAGETLAEFGYDLS